MILNLMRRLFVLEIGSFFYWESIFVEFLLLRIFFFNLLMLWVESIEFFCFFCYI